MSLSRGVSVQGVSVQGGLCPGRSPSREGLCPVGICSGVSVQGVSVQGDLCPEGFSVQRGSLSRAGGLCSGGSLFRGGLCPEGVSLQGRGSLSRGSLSGQSLSGGSLLGRPRYSNERAVRILLECILVYMGTFLLKRSTCGFS